MEINPEDRIYVVLNITKFSRQKTTTVDLLGYEVPSENDESMSYMEVFTNSMMAINPNRRNINFIQNTKTRMVLNSVSPFVGEVPKGIDQLAPQFKRVLIRDLIERNECKRIKKTVFNPPKIVRVSK